MKHAEYDGTVIFYVFSKYVHLLLLILSSTRFTQVGNKRLIVSYLSFLFFKFLKMSKNYNGYYRVAG